MKQNYYNYSKPHPSQPQAQASSEEVQQPKREVKMGVVNCQSLNVRSKPTTEENNVIGIIQHKTEVYILPDEKTLDGEFIKIRTRGGIEGYVMKRYINTNIASRQG